VGWGFGGSPIGRLNAGLGGGIGIGFGLGWGYGVGWGSKLIPEQKFPVKRDDPAENFLLALRAMQEGAQAATKTFAIEGKR